MFASEKRQRPRQQIKQAKLPFQQHKDSLGQSLQGTNLVEQYIKIRIQEPFKADDQTVAVQIPLNTLINEKKRFMDIENFSSYLLNYGGSDFPQIIQLCCTQMAGFVDHEGNPSHVIGYTEMSSVQGQVEGGFTTYNVVYKNGSSVIWDVSNISLLTFKLKLPSDPDYKMLPSAQPFNLELKIMRVIS